MYYYGLLCIAFFAAFFWLRINANVFYNVALSSVSLLNDLLSKEEEEINDLENAISKLAIDALVCGALRSDYQKSRIERMCENLGIIIAP